MPDRIFMQYIEDVKSRYNTDLIGDVALRLLDRWGLVTAQIDGEDSVGRSKRRNETPKEVVERAFRIATLYVESLMQGGHIRDLGPLAERRLLVTSYDGYRIIPVNPLSMKEEQEASRAK